MFNYNILNYSIASSDKIFRRLSIYKTVHTFYMQFKSFLRAILYQKGNYATSKTNNMAANLEVRK